MRSWAESEVETRIWDQHDLLQHAPPFIWDTLLDIVGWELDSGSCRSVLSALVETSCLTEGVWEVH